MEVWDGIAQDYDSSRNRLFEPRARRLVERAGISQGDRVLDLGTGTGIAAFLASEKVGPKGYVLGVDTSAKLLRVAEEKAGKAEVSNVEFRLMGMASLDLSEESFDHVIGNYSLCCTTQYEEALREAYRVLRFGGKLNYNHEGPHLPPPLMTYADILDRHKVPDPSPKTRRYREAHAVIEELWQGFRDPFVGLEKLRAAGFRGVEVAVTLERQVHPTIEAFMDSKLTGTFEYLEMDDLTREKLRRELRDSLKPMLSPEGLVIEVESLYLSGRKADQV